VKDKDGKRGDGKVEEREGKREGRDVDN